MIIQWFTKWYSYSTIITIINYILCSVLNFVFRVKCPLSSPRQVAKVHPGDAPPGSEAQPLVRPPAKWVRCVHVGSATMIVAVLTDQHGLLDVVGESESDLNSQMYPNQFQLFDLILNSHRNCLASRPKCQGTAKPSWPRLPRRGCWKFRSWCEQSGVLELLFATSCNKDMFIALGFFRNCTDVLSFCCRPNFL